MGSTPSYTGPVRENELLVREVPAVHCFCHFATPTDGPGVHSATSAHKPAHDDLPDLGLQLLPTSSGHLDDQSLLWGFSSGTSPYAYNRKGQPFQQAISTQDWESALPLDTPVLTADADLAVSEEPVLRFPPPQGGQLPLQERKEYAAGPAPCNADSSAGSNGPRDGGRASSAPQASLQAVEQLKPQPWAVPRLTAGTVVEAQPTGSQAGYLSTSSSPWLGGSQALQSAYFELQRSTIITEMPSVSGGRWAGQSGSSQSVQSCALRRPPGQQDPNSALPKHLAGKEERYKRLASLQLLRSAFNEREDPGQSAAIMAQVLATERSRRQSIFERYSARLRDLSLQHSLLEARECQMAVLLDKLDRARNAGPALLEQEHIILQTVQDMNCTRGAAGSRVCGPYRQMLASIEAQECWSGCAGNLSMLSVYVAWAKGQQGSFRQSLSVGGVACNSATLQQLATMASDSYSRLHMLYNQRIMQLLDEAFGGADALRSVAAQREAVMLIKELINVRVSYAMAQPLDLHTITKEQCKQAASADRAHMAQVMRVGNFSRKQIAMLWRLWEMRCERMDILSAMEEPLRQTLRDALAAAVGNDGDRYLRLLDAVAELKANHEEQVMVNILFNSRVTLQCLQPMQVAAMCACASPYQIRIDLLFAADVVPRVTW